MIKIKQLKWESGSKTAFFDKSVGQYMIRHFNKKWEVETFCAKKGVDIPLGEYDSLISAKKAAQDHFEKFILSWIEQ